MEFFFNNFLDFFFFFGCVCVCVMRTKTILLRRRRKHFNLHCSWLESMTSLQAPVPILEYVPNKQVIMPIFGLLILDILQLK